MAQDEDDALRERLEQLPHFGTHDFVWEEVLPSLTGDADVELLRSEQMDGIENPDNDVNQVQGIGDYRSQSWHRIFAGRLPPEDDE